MKWEVRKVKLGWGIFLKRKYCKTGEPVCYGIAKHKRTIEVMVDRMNNPISLKKI